MQNSKPSADWILRTQAHLNYYPVLKEADRVTIGCRMVYHADSAPPISSANERVIQFVPADTHQRPPAVNVCIVPPLTEQSGWMTWHDRGDGNHNPEQRQAPALAYHSGTVMTVMSILRCCKYLPQCNGCSISQVPDWTGEASINHLGIYSLLIPVEGLGRAAAATNDLSWVEEIKNQDVISMCNVREAISEYYSSQGRLPDFPYVANPDFNPDTDFRFTDHGQSIAPNAQAALTVPQSARRIIRIENNAPTPQSQLNEQNVQMWNVQPQPSATQNA
eukprot:470479-Amphidinium_carterae.1